MSNHLSATIRFQKPKTSELMEIYLEDVYHCVTQLKIAKSKNIESVNYNPLNITCAIKQILTLQSRAIQKSKIRGSRENYVTQSILVQF